MKKFYAGVLVGALSVALSATAGYAAERTYFVSPKMIGPAYWTAAQKGVEQAAKDLDIEVIYNASNEADSSKQINLIQDMLSRKLDGIAIAANDAGAVVPVIKKAREAGIPVVTFDSDAPTSDRQYYLGAGDDVEIGAQMAESLAQQMGGKGEMAFMVSALGSQNQIDKVNGAEALLKEKYPDITVVTTLESGDDSQQAFANAQNLLQTYPNLGGILGYAGAETPAAAEVLEQALKAGTIKAGQIKATGIVVPSIAAPYLESGTLDNAFIWDPLKLGYAAVYVIDQLGQKKELGSEIEIPTVGTVKVDGANIYIGLLELTRENVKTFGF